MCNQQNHCELKLNLFSIFWSHAHKFLPAFVTNDHGSRVQTWPKWLHTLGFHAWVIHLPRFLSWDTARTGTAEVAGMTSSVLPIFLQIHLNCHQGNRSFSSGLVCTMRVQWIPYLLLQGRPKPLTNGVLSHPSLWTERKLTYC